MGVAVILILAVVVSVSKALYDPRGSVIDGSADDDYNDGQYGYNGNRETPNDLSNASREKLLAIVTALLQQCNNPYGPFTELFVFKGNKGKNQVNWRKWLGWSKSQIEG